MNKQDPKKIAQEFFSITGTSLEKISIGFTNNTYRLVAKKTDVHYTGVILIHYSTNGRRSIPNCFCLT